MLDGRAASADLFREFRVFRRSGTAKRDMLTR
jgi:hypothetical protein